MTMRVMRESLRNLLCGRDVERIQIALNRISSCRGRACPATRIVAPLFFKNSGVAGANPAATPALQKSIEIALIE
jgi:hypothetical protein